MEQFSEQKEKQKKKKKMWWIENERVEIRAQCRIKHISLRICVGIYAEGKAFRMIF